MSAGEGLLDLTSRGSSKAPETTMVLFLGAFIIYCFPRSSSLFFLSSKKSLKSVEYIVSLDWLPCQRESRRHFKPITALQIKHEGAFLAHLLRCSELT